ncbi:hypothetical protein [Parabacteroides johnsonii]|uniref:hypothetical protein n=1 Tax=Parabacteroides johnsonii TaxID=387661 RepID=UPI00242DCA33|nr:hypothetical protein [Parabacteroides johnsonii]MBS6225309.1 hypothetical protein [Parabacteroides johnsonii]
MNSAVHGNEDGRHGGEDGRCGDGMPKSLKIPSNSVPYSLTLPLVSLNIRFYRSLALRKYQEFR